MSKAHYYLRDDELMLEVHPGQFINKVAAVRLGLVGPNTVEDIERRLRPKRPPITKRAKSKRAH
jgi:hypothetical protein